MELTERTFFEHASDGPDHILKVRGELDIYTAPHFKAALKRISTGFRIIVDLTDCRYLDASAIGTLVEARDDSAVPIRLVLRDGSMVRRVFQITQVDRLFAIFATVEAACGRERRTDISRPAWARPRPDRADRGPR